MEKKYVWEFTNQKKLTKKEFIDYFERKVFRTIRKYEMLPKNKEITIKKTEELNNKILIKILGKKFTIKFTTKPKFTDENASDITERTVENILNGKIKGPTPTEKTNKPLYFLSDKETELYAELTNLKGNKRRRKKEIENLLKIFKEKNQDLEQNVLKCLTQI